jgi:predicted Zn-dependent protease
VLKELETRFRQAAPAVEFCSLRYVHVRSEGLEVRQDVPEPIYRREDTGAMVTVMDGGGLGYAATSDLSAGGLKAAAERAALWARRTAGRCVIDFRKVVMPQPTGQYAGPCAVPWESLGVAGKFDMLVGLSKRLKAGQRIADWSASLWHSDIEMLYLTAGGGRVHQTFHLTGPGLSATANDGANSQTRTFGALALCQQGGLEVLDRTGFAAAPEPIAADALALLAAPNCPSDRMDLLLGPDQMVLQIHESIGHPLELDRILGDERNYAGTSFVTPDMIGSYRYGSDLLNVTFDPSRGEQLASYGYDDEALRAERVYVIRGGILQRALGSTVSQARAGLPGVANSRADTWNRPPIDRMANLNVEPGTSTMEDMIASVRHGVYMQTNNSWSIDDSRNKFQFGCEWGRLIEDGKLTKLVRNPNYRGISATFWRNLKAVGTAGTLRVMGTPNCGKGEPNQIMYVAHASPACLFADVDVFGGA